MTIERSHWLKVLALTPGGTLRNTLGPLIDGESFSLLRRPEVGLVMAQARIGNTGERFNLAEVTVCRCVVRSRLRTAGVGYCIGRDLGKVELIARLDALFQTTEWHDRLRSGLLCTLETLLTQHRRDEREAAESSRVRFHELVAT